MSIDAVLQAGSQTQFTWIAPSGVTQLAEILVVAGEQCCGSSHHSALMHGQNKSQTYPMSTASCSTALPSWHVVRQVVEVEVAMLEVEVVQAESSTRPTTQSHLAQPTALLWARGGQGALMLLVLLLTVPMGRTPPSLHLIHRQP
jgi:hypothetical protein